MLYLRSTNLLEYELTDRLTGEPVTGATVTGVIRDPLGELFVVSAPSTTTLTFTEVGSSGVYRATLTSTAATNLVYGNVYRGEITSVADGVTLFDVQLLVALEA